MGNGVYFVGRMKSLDVKIEDNPKIPLGQKFGCLWEGADDKGIESLGLEMEAFREGAIQYLAMRAMRAEAGKE